MVLRIICLYYERLSLPVERVDLMTKRVVEASHWKVLSIVTHLTLYRFISNDTPVIEIIEKVVMRTHIRGIPPIMVDANV